MKLPRRQFLHLAAGAAALPTVPRFAARDCKNDNFYRRGPVKVIEIIRTPKNGF